MAAKHGTFVALPTPFTAQRGLDEGALEHLISYLSERKQVGGFALSTEAAEDELLTFDERLLIVRMVGKRKRDDHSLLVRIADFASRQAADFAKQAEDAGATVLTIRLPRLPGVGYRELYRHVDYISRAVSVPVLLDQGISDGLQSLQIEELETLVQHPRLGGVVTQTPHASDLKLWERRLADREEFMLLAGSSLDVVEMTESGATGRICGHYLLMPELADEIIEAFIGGEVGKARKLQMKMAPARAILSPAARADNPGGLKKLTSKLASRALEEKALPSHFSPAMIKATLHLQGHPVRADVRSPYETLKGERLEKFAQQLRRTGVLV
ncbi:MAG: dihydrodipicolinate synthase family protein [Myxococcota bacterium]|nr:dihydrodipicolinate synthase family protein [Myxococcota bacterium]